MKNRMSLGLLLSLSKTNKSFIQELWSPSTLRITDFPCKEDVYALIQPYISGSVLSLDISILHSPLTDRLENLNLWLKTLPAFSFKAGSVVTKCDPSKWKFRFHYTRNTGVQPDTLWNILIYFEFELYNTLTKITTKYTIPASTVVTSVKQSELIHLESTNSPLTRYSNSGVWIVVV